MIPVTPNPDIYLLPEGSRAVVYAEDQPEYMPLPSIQTPDGRVVTAWKPDANELALLNAGVPVTIVVYTFGGPLQPLMVVAGGADMRQA